MIRPTVALPTGPFDLDATQFPEQLFQNRLAALRTVMREHGVTHTVVHGSVFDHEALSYFTCFTPKLGPAYALIPADGAPKLLFSGGPGMKPSAARLTWIADVVALRGIEADMTAWLKQTASEKPVKLGLIEGSGMSRRDWQSVLRAGGNQFVELDSLLPIPQSEADDAREICARIEETFGSNLDRDRDIRAAVLDIERLAYRHGAQDVRVLVALRPGRAPTRLPDVGRPLAGPTRIALAICCRGQWHDATFTLTPRA